jgi:hypothetical protein
MSTKKGIKRTKNKPVLHEGLKKHRGVWLTDETWNKVREKAVEKGLSCSEYLEQLIRECHGS